MLIPPGKFSTYSIRSSPWSDQVCRLLAATIDAADPASLIRKNISFGSGKLALPGTQLAIEDFDRIFVIGAGKAVVPMAECIADILGRTVTSGLVITKDGYARENSVLPDAHIKVIEAAHPVPDARNTSATGELLLLTSRLTPKDLVICLISGGGSALLTQPSHGLTLEDIRQLTSTLLECGAAIDEINTIRKHLDDVKGGGLARHLYPARVVSLILSDVIGDSLDLIASGPTVPDPSTFADAWAILSKYHLPALVPERVRSHIFSGMESIIPETVKPGNSHFENVSNHIIGNNSQLVERAYQLALAVGFNAKILPGQLAGEAAFMGKTLIETSRHINESNEASGIPNCYIAGGETIVSVHGNGLGGRNQELALGAVEEMAGLAPMMLVSLATDGGDGPTDAAGAVATNLTLTRGLECGLNPADFLHMNDAYHYFDSLDDLVRIGPTLTNLNDLVFIFTG